MNVNQPRYSTIVYHKRMNVRACFFLSAKLARNLRGEGLKHQLRGAFFLRTHGTPGASGKAVRLRTLLSHKAGQQFQVRL